MQRQTGDITKIAWVEGSKRRSGYDCLGSDHSIDNLGVGKAKRGDDFAVLHRLNFLERELFDLLEKKVQPRSQYICERWVTINPALQFHPGEDGNQRYRQQRTESFEDRPSPSRTRIAALVSRITVKSLQPLAFRE